jgi:hypothetical protein
MVVHVLMVLQLINVNVLRHILASIVYLVHAIPIHVNLGKYAYYRFLQMTTQIIMPHTIVKIISNADLLHIVLYFGGKGGLHMPIIIE